MEKQLVIFELADENYGLDISSVESIIKMQAITVVPHAPNFVEGVTNLRGKVLPVIDLRKRFNLPGRQVDKDSRIIVVSFNKKEIGMMVDSVSEVLTINTDVVEPPPALVTTIDSAFITGIAKIDTRLVILLDLAEVFSLEEKEALQTLEPVRA
jgi:purine-binding chemotaxis protein CheW